MEREKDEMDLDRKIDKNVCKEIKNIERQWNKAAEKKRMKRIFWATDGSK